jgi:hypothetical protein
LGIADKPCALHAAPRLRTTASEHEISEGGDVAVYPSVAGATSNKPNRDRLPVMNAKVRSYSSGESVL